MTDTVQLTTQVQRLADSLRLRALRMVAPHGFGYLGQALSSAELLAAFHLASEYRPNVDDLICSPGHYIIGPYALAAERGELTDEDLASYGHNDSALEAIGTERSPGVNLTCGSLGQGLSAAAGFAIAARMAASDARTYVLLSDGEVEEGQVWEAAMFIAHSGLGRVLVLLDANNSQVDGRVDSITTIDPLADKWEAFGWAAVDVDGHDPDELVRAFGALRADPRPGVLIARTSTTHGLDCLPPDADGHFIKLPAALARAAEQELESRLA